MNPRALAACCLNIFLTSLVLLLPRSAHAEDWVIVLGEVEIRERPGFAQPALEKSPEFSLYKVVSRVEAEKEGSQTWYEIVLREDRRIKQKRAAGWVLQLPEDAGPLSKPSVPVYKTPDAGTLIGSKRNHELSLTGMRSPDGKWHEVRFDDKVEHLRQQVGYVPASLAWLEEDPELTELVPRLERIRNSDWPAKWKAFCVRRTIRKGFPRAAVELALGEPTQIGSPVTAKADEVWTYRKDDEMVGIYFKGGKVVGWKKKKARR